MSSPNPVRSESLHHWIVVRPEPTGQFTAQLLGLPELHATAASREQAIEQLRTLLEQWLASGQLAPLVISAGNALRNWPGHDPADPLEQEFLADLERAARESPSCSNTSSTPTT